MFTIYVVVVHLSQLLLSFSYYNTIGKVQKYWPYSQIVFFIINLYKYMAFIMPIVNIIIFLKTIFRITTHATVLLNNTNVLIHFFFISQPIHENYWNLLYLFWYKIQTFKYSSRVNMPSSFLITNRVDYFLNIEYTKSTLVDLTVQSY